MKNKERFAAGGEMSDVENFLLADDFLKFAPETLRTTVSLVRFLFPGSFINTVHDAHWITNARLSTASKYATDCEKKLPRGKALIEILTQKWMIMRGWRLVERPTNGIFCLKYNR